jgi:hypothetical protein
VKYLILTNATQQDYDAMVGKGDGSSAWTPEDFERTGAFMEALNNELAESGELIATYGLDAPVHSRRLQTKDGASVVTDGPYAETQEVLAGFWIVECESFDRATEIAARLSSCPAPADVVANAYADIRPIMDSRNDLDL